jgi:hypothetical protein
VEVSGVANGIRFSRCEVSAASEAVGWKRWLGRFCFIQENIRI